jgi:thiamine biosynthesis lipoprotein
MKTTPIEANSLKRYNAPAMNTVFSFRFAVDAADSPKLAGEAERLLQELEMRWSRFIPESEICQINRLQPGQEMFLSDVTCRCLVEAVRANVATDGLFDACVTGGRGQSPDQTPAFSLDEEKSLIVRQRAGPCFDLGGIAKGFALDVIAGHCAALGAPDCLLSAGNSTHLATGCVAAQIEGPPPLGKSLPPLQGGALATSGVGVQGEHICDPLTGHPPAHYQHQRLCVFAPTGAEADAFATACMLMTAGEIEDFVASRSGAVSVYPALSPEP